MQLQAGWQYSKAFLLLRKTSPLLNRLAEISSFAQLSDGLLKAIISSPLPYFSYWELPVVSEAFHIQLHLHFQKRSHLSVTISLPLCMKQSKNYAQGLHEGRH